MKSSVVVAIVIGVLFACAESCVQNIYANDPFYDTVSFKDGLPGTVATIYRPYNRDSALSYNQYYANMFTISPQGGSRAAFYDLGTNALFPYRYNVSLIGGNTAYLSIHVNKEGQIVYATSDTYNPDDDKAFQPFNSQVTSALQNMRSDLPSTSFYPEVGHIYLINIYNSQYGETYLTKMVVLDVSPNNATVAIRWDVISSTREETLKAKCFVSIDTNPPQATNTSPVGDATAANSYDIVSLTLTICIVLPILFVLIVLLGVFMLVMFKSVRQITGYYSTAMSKFDEKKPLIQK